MWKTLEKVKRWSAFRQVIHRVFHIFNRLAEKIFKKGPFVRFAQEWQKIPLKWEKQGKIWQEKPLILFPVLEKSAAKEPTVLAKAGRKGRVKKVEDKCREKLRLAKRIK